MFFHKITSDIIIKLDEASLSFFNDIDELSVKVLELVLRFRRIVST